MSRALSAGGVGSAGEQPGMKFALRSALIAASLVVAFAQLPARAEAPTGTPVGPHRVGCDVTEMSGVHIHAHLAIVEHGKRVPVPAGIGIVGAGNMVFCLYWLHTHDASGLIHVEAPGGHYTLADFFAVWGEPLGPKQVAQYRGAVSASVNGKPYRGAPGSIPIRDGEKIVLRVR